MTRRVSTTVSVQLRFTLPVGANAAMAIAWIREALEAHKTAGTEYPAMRGLLPNELIVKLQEKRTNYL